MQQVHAVPAPFQNVMSSELAKIRVRADELKLRISDLEVRKHQLSDQRRRLGGDVDPTPIDKQLADVEHELASARIQLESMDKQMSELEMERDMARVGTTVVPPPEPVEVLLARERMVGFGTIVILLPLALALARRLWHRGPARPAVDLEESPRLQRMEQAIESIAVEVERIGEAQRFTTKLLTDRDAAARIPIVPRKEPGTITPH